MIRTLALVVVTAALAFAAPASAQVTGKLSPRPIATLRSSIIVNSDIVRIGDMIDNAGAAAAVPIFRSPDIGTTGAVPVGQVLAAIRGHDLVVVDTGSLTEVVVTRAGQALSSKDIEGRIARVFAGRQGLGEEKALAVTLDREASPLGLDASAANELAVRSAYYDRRIGRFDVTFEIAGTRTLIRYTGAIVEMADAAVLTRPMGRGEIIKSSDVAIERRPKAEIGTDAVDGLDQAVGFAVRQLFTTGRVLRRADLIKPDLVKRDQPVTLIFEVPGIVLTMRGKALDNGGDGDVINVVNLQSKRNVQGRVAGPGRVIVSALDAAPQTTVAAVAARRQAE